jgi:hypothetical protein
MGLQKTDCSKFHLFSKNSIERRYVFVSHPVLASKGILFLRPITAVGDKFLDKRVVLLLLIQRGNGE